MGCGMNLENSRTNTAAVISRVHAVNTSVQVIAPVVKGVEKVAQSFEKKPLISLQSPISQLITDAISQNLHSNAQIASITEKIKASIEDKLQQLLQANQIETTYRNNKSYSIFVVLQKSHNKVKEKPREMITFWDPLAKSEKPGNWGSFMKIWEFGEFVCYCCIDVIRA
jgi:hypothetical protein